MEVASELRCLLRRVRTGRGPEKFVRLLSDALATECFRGRASGFTRSQRTSTRRQITDRFAKKIFNDVEQRRKKRGASVLSQGKKKVGRGACSLSAWETHQSHGERRGEQ
ncbi:hypothetical protein CRG98_001508 [Punica granatum]|uniref:Uncharacterized protein n=1 Tax=Punica granatum TaxID=22663 RepID=A0A2I0LBW9_PUNGR|nr:hypothetical protein CRG98_001508 [Punica granatum]